VRPRTRRFARIALLLAIPAVALLARALLAPPPLIADTPVTLETTEFGHGPTIVFLHGLGGARMGWMPVARPLLAGHRIVLVDLPGHGESPLPDPFSIEAAAAALDAVLARFAPDSTFLVAQGVGGIIALKDVQAHPGRVKGLVLVDVAVKSTLPVTDQEKPQFLSFIDQNYDAFLKMMFVRMGRDSAQGVALHAQAAQVPPATIKAYVRALLSVDASSALKELEPRLVLIATGRFWPADKDWPTVAKLMGYDDPGAIAVERIVSSGLVVAKDQPDSLAALVSRFAATTLSPR